MSILLSLLLAPCSYAGSLSIGPMGTVPTSEVDHAKIGASINAEFRLFARDLRISLDVGFKTLSVVNPGAAPLASAPDQDESSTGSSPFYLGAQLLLDTSVLCARPGLGIQTYYTDLGGTGAAGVPVAPSFFLNWTLGEGALTGGAVLAAGVQATSFSPLTLIAQPELSARWGMSQSLSLSLHAMATTVQAFSSPGVTVVYPRAQLRLGFQL